MIITVSQCWDLYRRKHLPETVAADKNIGYWSRLSWFKDKDAEALSPMEVERYLKHRGYPKVTMASSINRELGLLRACLRFAERHKLIQRAPLVKALPRAATRVSSLSKVQAQKLLKTSDERDIWQERAFLRLALGTGQRPGAVIELRWDQLTGDVIDFRPVHDKSARMKGRAVVPLNDLAKEGLAIAAAHKEGPLVLHHDGRPISRIGRLLHRVARAADVPVTPHVLRHTVASTLLQDGVDLLHVSRLLGHANTIITQTVYFQHQPEWLKSAVDKLEF